MFAILVYHVSGLAGTLMKIACNSFDMWLQTIKASSVCWIKPKKPLG